MNEQSVSLHCMHKGIVDEQTGEILAEPCSLETLRLKFGLSTLTESARHHLIPAHSPQVYLCGTVTSSLDVARYLAKNALRDTERPLPSWSSVLVMGQRSGRGQLGRTWVSPPGNVYATLVLPTEPPFTEDVAALAAGALLVQALAALGIHARMKWPNDLIIQIDGTWRKVGGLLVEMRHGLILLGVGLNMISAPSDNAMRHERAFMAGCLPPEVLQSHDGLYTFWETLVQGVQTSYKTCALNAAWLATILRQLAFLGETVQLDDGAMSPVYTGRFLGIDASGGIRLWVENHERVFYSGSLRLP